MKKLSNVSPFLLLLFPVFVMMLLAFATGTSNNQDEVAMVKTSSPTNTIVKATTAILK
jgi:hypothetical protein